MIEMASFFEAQERDLNKHLCLRINSK